MPWDAWLVCPILAEIWQQPVDEVRTQLKSNLWRLLSSGAP